MVRAKVARLHRDGTVTVTAQFYLDAAGKGSGHVTLGQYLIDGTDTPDPYDRRPNGIEARLDRALDLIAALVSVLHDKGLMTADEIAAMVGDTWRRGPLELTEDIVEAKRV